MDTRRVVNALNNMTDSKGLPAQHPVGLYKPLIDKFVWCFNQDAAQEYSEGQCFDAAYIWFKLLSDKDMPIFPEPYFQQMFEFEVMVIRRLINAIDKEQGKVPKQILALKKYLHDLNEPSSTHKVVPGVVQAKRNRLLFDAYGNVIEKRLRLQNIEPPLEKGTIAYQLRDKYIGDPKRRQVISSEAEALKIKF